MSNHEGFSDPTAEVAVGRWMKQKRKEKGKGKGRKCPGQMDHPLPDVGAELVEGPLVYICSRYSGKDEKEVRQHRLYARSFSYYALSQGAVPVAPHLLYPQFLREELPTERVLGHACGLRLLAMCDALWVFDVDGISSGMALEIQFAKMIGIPVKMMRPEMDGGDHA